MEQKSIFHEPLVVETWWTPHFNQKYHVSMTVSYLFYSSQMTGSAQNCQIWKKGPKWVKRDQKRSKGAKRGPMEPKSRFHEPVVVETL